VSVKCSTEGDVFLQNGGTDISATSRSAPSGRKFAKSSSKTHRIIAKKITLKAL